MENAINEISLQETLNYLKEQKSNFLGGTLKTHEKFLKKVDELIERTENLRTKDNFENTVVVGSLVDLMINYGDGEIEYVTYYLGLDFAENVVSILSPLGSAIFGADVQSTVSYKVNDNYMEATILNKNVIVEKFPEDITVSNSISEGPVKSKI